MSKVKRKKKNVKQEEEAKTLGEGILVEEAPSSPSPDIPQRTWRYPWEKAWCDGLEVKWK